MNLAALPPVTLGFICFVSILTLGFHVRYKDQTITYGPTILTTTGIFATFLGIALGLAEFDSASIQNSVPALLDGLKTAFWASVFGVGGALSIKFRHLLLGSPASSGSGVDGEITPEDLAAILKGIQQALVGNDDSTIVSQLKLSRQDANDRLDALKKAQQEALLELSKLGSAQLVEALRDVIRDFNNKITEQFGDNFRQLNDAVGKLLVWQEQYKAHIEMTSAHQAGIVESMKSASDNYTELVTQAGIFVSISKTLAELLNSLETQKQQLIVSLRALADLLNTASAGLPKIESQVVELTRQLVASVTANQLEVNKALTENSELIRSSSEQAARLLATTTAANQKEVNDALATSVQFIRTSIQGVGQDFAKINAEFNRQLADAAEKTKQQVAVLDAALTEELKKSLESLARQLAALSEKFVSDYLPLTQRLAEILKIAPE